MAESVTEVKLFAKWSLDDVEVSDLALVDFLAIKGKNATFVPHTAGKYQRKRFKKAQVRPWISLEACSLRFPLSGTLDCCSVLNI